MKQESHEDSEKRWAMMSETSDTPNPGLNQEGRRHELETGRDWLSLVHGGATLEAIQQALTMPNHDYENLINAKIAQFKRVVASLRDISENPLSRTKLHYGRIRKLVAEYLPDLDCSLYLDELHGGMDLRRGFYVDQLLKSCEEDRENRIRNNQATRQSIQSNGYPFWLQSHLVKFARPQLLSDEGYVRDNESVPWEEAKPPGTFGRIPTFVVEQGGTIDLHTFQITSTKKRLIWDCRDINSAAVEKTARGQIPRLILPSTATIAGALTLMMTGRNVAPQTTKDITHDIRETLNGTPPSKRSDPRTIRRTFDKPQITKFDWSSYFRVFMTSALSSQHIHVWNYELSRMQSLTSSTAGFGSLHSLYLACRTSELVVRIFARVFGIIIFVYIDDQIILSPTLQMAQVDAFIVRHLSELLKLPIAHHKTESTQFLDTVTLLGSSYRIRQSVCKISPKVEHLVKAAELVETAIKNLMEGDVTPSLLQQIYGKVLFICSNTSRRTELFVAIQLLYPWSIQRFFESNVRRLEERAVLLCSLRRILYCLEATMSEPQRQCLTIQCNVPLVSQEVMTDASFANGVSHLGGHVGPVRINPRLDTSRSVEGLRPVVDAYCFYHKENADSPSILTGIKHRPDIALYELLALVLALYTYSDKIDTNAQYIHFYVDNIVTLYHCIKSTGRYRMDNFVIISALIQCLNNKLPATAIPYFSYVMSKLNEADLLTRVERNDVKQIVYDKQRNSIEQVSEKVITTLNSDLKSLTGSTSQQLEMCRNELRQIQNRKQVTRRNRSTKDLKKDFAVSENAPSAKKRRVD